ncbi:MAG TPA: hypothetical protein VGP81_10950 [Pyrinomonadaceae bacterium]|nr:hypothetical protein [Pyrinomonadaceae bacterium]
MSEKENSSNADGGGSRQGLSKEAWVAISTIAAALITGIVTLIVHLAPQKPAATTAPTPAATASASVTAQTAAGINADAIAGKWAGKAKDKIGQEFEIALEVRKSCGINQPCGSISVSNVPCYGEITLERAHDPTFEFNVVRFYGQSDRQKCQPGPGEEFQLRPDGKLDYRSTYEPTAEGVLERTKD